ncbi:hypothetical protein CSB45_08400 [candidate division KSB3 bacterium]|uniref:O-antigen ligase-related domain-containing protein n=1 Tax=candidate division KSB3 bacterium TaxID=2044937 RepID=A0A2G6E587_9BACT|nr:MAG: hypothetical protein CSB45_08400 [candidate division KSB3 bacterium]PIE29762.1 MAG: hypothetical protein CSA57_06815 [candidate division KSB3 bacterium]
METGQAGQPNCQKICQQLKTLSLYGIIFFTPISIAFSSICLALLTSVYLVEMIVTRRIPRPQSPLNRPLVVFILVTIGLTPFALHVEKSFIKLTNLSSVAVFFVLLTAMQEGRHLRKYVAILIVSMSIGSLYGVLQHFLRIDVFRFNHPISFLKHLNNDLTAPVRISGFTSYMTFGGQLAMILPFIFAYLLLSPTLRDKILWSVVGLINGSALLWTYTRSAWIGGSLAIIVIGLIATGKNFWKYLLLTILFLGPCCMLRQSLDSRPVPPPSHKVESLPVSRQGASLSSDTQGPVRRMLESDIVKRLFSIVELQSNLERLYTWQSSFQIFRDHLFTGIGHGNYSETCVPYRMRYGDFEFTSDAHAHNMLLQIAVIGGIPLLGAFLWLWVTLFRSSYQRYRHTAADDWNGRALTLGGFGALMAFSIHGMFEHTFGDSEVLLLLWLLYALSQVAFEVGDDAQRCPLDAQGDVVMPI